MFSFLKFDPIKKLQRKRSQLLEKAMHIQRSGDLKLYASSMVEIEEIEKEMERLNQNGKDKN